MRGADRQTCAMFSYLSPEKLVPATHPLRAVRPLVNAALKRLSGEFDKITSRFGRGLDSTREAAACPAAPGALLGPLRAAVDGADRLQHDAPEVRRPVDGCPGLGCDGFHQNRERLLEGDIARAFLSAILVDPQVRPLLSDEHFSVVGTLIDAWASMIFASSMVSSWTLLASGA